VKSIVVGDIFLSVTGNRWTITEIECGLNEDEDRWETSIRFDLFVASTGLTHSVTEKARIVVQTLSTDGFYTQVHASGDVTQSNVIKPTGNSVIQNNFIEIATKYGLSPSDLGRTIMRNGSKYQIVGERLHKEGPMVSPYPIIVEGSGGELKRFSVDEVKKGLELYNSRMASMIVE
jgi:hypothetical protein